MAENNGKTDLEEENEAPQQEKSKEPKRTRVIVHRLGVDPKNQYDAIPLNAVGKVIGVTVIPGKPVRLTDTQIEILKNARIVNEIPLPPDSGSYELADGMALAEQHYPGHTAVKNPVTGEIVMHKETPKYAVELAQ